MKGAKNNYVSYEGKRELDGVRELLLNIKELQNEIEALKDQNDLLAELLRVSDPWELTGFYSEYSSQFGNTDVQCDGSFIDSLNLLSVVPFFGYRLHCQMQDRMVIEVLPLCGDVGRSCFVFFSCTRGQGVRYEGSTLPPCVPVQEMANKYLNVQDQDVTSFLFSLMPHLQAFETKKLFLKVISEKWDGVSAYLDDAGEELAFSFTGTKCDVDFYLHYKKSETIPYNVVFVAPDDVLAVHQSVLQQLQKELQKDIVPNVLARFPNDIFSKGSELFEDPMELSDTGESYLDFGDSF